MKKVLLKIQLSVEGASGCFTFYYDGTYIHDSWKKETVSKWKLEDGFLWAQHQVGNEFGLQSAQWLKCDNSYHGHIELYRALEDALVKEILLV